MSALPTIDQCRHGTDVTLRVTSERREDCFVLKATETICPYCTRELAEAYVREVIGYQQTTAMGQEKP